VFLSKLTRTLLVAGLLFWIAAPFLVGGEALENVDRHLPETWGGLRLLAPLFLALDGTIAYLAISVTRGDE
jgi:hypothetical protein